MQRVIVAILHCGGFDSEKLKAYFGKPESPEAALRWELEFGIAVSILILIFSEIYHWKSIRRQSIRNGGSGNKKAPLKLRKNLIRLMRNSESAETENERIAKLRKGIEEQIEYLGNIKRNEAYLSSVALQHVHECMEDLLKLEIAQ